MTRKEFETSFVEILIKNKISHTVDFGSACDDYVASVADGLELKISLRDLAVSVSVFNNRNHVSFMDVFYNEMSSLTFSDKSLFFGIEGKATLMTVALA